MGKVTGKSYSHQLDAKNRMRIPAKLREELGDEYFVTVGSGNCLCVYTAKQMEEVNKFLSSVNPYREEEARTARFIISNTWQAEEDKQGRILLPENLRKFAKIEKEIFVFKGINSVEIWSKEVWENYFKDVKFSALADFMDSLKKNNG